MLSIYFQVCIVARCSDTNSHPFISYKIVYSGISRGICDKNRIIRTMFAKNDRASIREQDDERWLPRLIRYEKLLGEMKYTSSYIP